MLAPSFTIPQATELQCCDRVTNKSCIPVAGGDLRYNLAEASSRFNTEGTFKKDGKLTGHVTRVVSPDGKVWTLTVDGTDAQGKPYSSVLVFDKK